MGEILAFSRFFYHALSYFKYFFYLKVTLKILLTKPEDGVKNKEGTLRLSVQPLRLNIDQDSIYFLKTFFSEISEDDSSQFTSQQSEGKKLKS